MSQVEPTAGAPGSDDAPGSLQRSPLHQRHVALGAKLASFGGWSMPLEYAGGVLREHAAVRERVGIFDVSHLGKVRVLGSGAAAHVDACLTNALDRIGPGRAQYTLACDAESGGVVDDLIAYLHDEDHVFLIPNAANAGEVARRLREAAPPGVEVRDEHREHAVLAVQGPRSREVLSAAGLSVDLDRLDSLDYMAFAVGDLDGGTVTVCRTGYTGERGYELVLDAAVAGKAWDGLLSAGRPLGIEPCGLGARDTLRTEMGYPLHGQDISPSVTPVEARLGWAVGWDKPAFWGRDALLAQRAEGPRRVLRGLVAEGRGIPRPGMKVLLSDDTTAGEVTSGTFSPSLRKGVGLALLAREVTEDTLVQVDVRGRREAFRVTRPPFVPSHVR